jgi:hypothetical protein
LFVDAAYVTRPPFFDNVYVSPRTRDAVQASPVSETIRSLEGGYIMNAPNLKLRLSGYYTEFDDGMNVISFFHDEYQNLVNYALSNIDRVHFGGELGFEAKIAPGLSLNGAAAIGRYYFNSRQNATVTLDNTSALLSTDTIYAQNFRVGSTPQEAYSLGLTYRSPNFWFVSLTGNYFDQMWLDFNPLRRSYAAVQDVEYKSDKWNQIIDQTRWNGQYTLDFFAGYSWKLPRKYRVNGKSMFLVLNAGVNNLTNNQNIITGGFEQLRFDFDNKDVNKFPPRLFYAYGLNYFLSATVRF